MKNEIMDKIELVRRIGDEVCEDCSPFRDCGIEPDDCDRIIIAVGLLNDYLSVHEGINEPTKDHGNTIQPGSD